ncbi:response regulator transcription factor [Streptomyces zagrosensis]|uniref:DNA-binding CsgD family transcriptional regulator n=1 Tax=Streptomyces zagrosensis TaxID=1042984 RepID=A0A7W9QGV2_9ACTN|nr:helix-turn-helix transcriptional regulator [Streptomyces zagrosensis]MBB5938982.1 DNA-binding CsgD family transcriptional regulator [Streptomyces zagrosensis]
MDHFQQGALQRLSAREREVLVYLAAGHTYAAIAHCMEVSPHTVDTYLRRIRGKTGARHRMHLLLLAMGVTAPKGTRLPPVPAPPASAPRTGLAVEAS